VAAARRRGTTLSGMGQARGGGGGGGGVGWRLSWGRLLRCHRGEMEQELAHSDGPWIDPGSKDFRRGSRVWGRRAVGRPVGWMCWLGFLDQERDLVL
jgi:hypothetical protein